MSINISNAQNYQDSNFEFASSFNPVGSGARAMGMGGAFIAVADDATASSWNPAGLIQLLYPEASYVYNHTRRKEKNSFNTIDAGGTHHFDVFTNSSDEVNTNFVSFLFPMHLMRRNMIFSISTQCLYDFNRNWNFNIDRSSFVDHWQYNQQGNLSALSFSYCIQVQSGLSIGATLNVWDDDITSNSWVQDYKRNAILNNGKSDYQLVKREEFVLKALNANFGILWRVNENLQVGAVLKTPFNADIKRQSFSYELFPETNETKSNTSQFEETIIMPMSYGIGMSYKVNEQFSLSGDIYQTKWNHFEYIKYDQQRISAIQLPMNQSQIEPAIHLRLGMDYKLRYANKAIWYPLRAGLFYDPIASQKNPDDMYGASMGFGVTKAEHFSFDMAYQYRHGKDLFAYMVEGMDFSQEINEHLIYLSLILYYGS
jgi:long-subunit fatty acid transport protein